MRNSINLNRQQLEVLACIQHRADSSVSSIAKLTGLRAHSVRRTLSLLVDKGIIYKRAYISLYRLGYSKRALFFSLTKTHDSVRAALRKYLLNHPSIAYVAQVGGDFSYKIDICSRNESELYEFLTSFSENFGPYLREKSLVQLISQTEFGVKYPIPKQVRIPPLWMGIQKETEEIDELDHKILRALSEIGERSISALAREIGIPATTLAYRIEALKTRKILLGFRYIISLEFLGGLDYYHLVYVRGMNPAAKRRLIQFCRDNPFVRYFVECIGNWDFEIGSNVQSISDSTQLTEELHDIVGDDIIRISTLPLFGYLRVSSYPIDY